ncbi:MAG: DJ-1/PfpI family protein [Peptostreptococcaceae bacterium]|nr:DJ-1/PfpI family protein [Peptostreptococcaceae bacterium]
MRTDSNRKKKIALVVYPEFSFQEIADLCRLFRWNYDSMTVVFSSSKEPVRSEEGFVVLPEKTFDEFSKEDYDCLILPGCSDLRAPLADEKLKTFLERFRDEKEFVIGAICSGPIFLAQAGLLKGRKFTASLYMEMYERFRSIEQDNVVFESIVEDGNIITATGDAFALFAIAIARKLGYDCPDKLCDGMGKPDPSEQDYRSYLPEEGLKEMEEAFGQYF